MADQGSIRKIEQVKIDALQLNKIIVEGKTVDLNGKQGIDWSDPAQIFVLSSDGAIKTQVSPDNYYTKFWVVNEQTGVLVLTGQFDSNGNGKLDDSDKLEIIRFDLQEMVEVVSD